MSTMQNEFSNTSKMISLTDAKFYMDVPVL